MDMLKKFMFNDNAVRIINKENEAWFVAKDVADILGYGKTEAMTRRMDEDEKGTTICSTLGGEQEITIINESGLYHAIFGSRKKVAVDFRKWVTGDVLPQIRKTGGYIHIAKDDTVDDVIHKTNMILQNTIKEMQDKLIKAENQIKYINAVTLAYVPYPNNEKAKLLEDGKAYKRRGSIIIKKNNKIQTLNIF